MTRKLAIWKHRSSELERYFIKRHSSYLRQYSAEKKISALTISSCFTIRPEGQTGNFVSTLKINRSHVNENDSNLKTTKFGWRNGKTRRGGGMREDS
jgi:hypothetical protein